ncbi:MAG: glutamate 5-kinase [Clostridiales Family XIII bacterium]|jgi:glutamate 5-kinase|nr:glutamate 5-kinase [Clostridiales Family XIII bacterium]
MGKANEILRSGRKIVLKIGSNVLTGVDGRPDAEIIANIADQVSNLIEGGKQMILVSSGAEISGAGAIGRWNRHGDINYKQALCAIGQVELMLAYKKSFAKRGISVGQMLLTRDNFSDNNSSLHIRNTLFTLLDEKVIPIINENDSVSVEEMSIGDNDALAALTANLWNADLLILMSDIDGVYDKSPKDNAGATLIREVDDTERLEREIDVTGKSPFGTGGMVTKIEAAKSVGRFGTPLLLVNGKKTGILDHMIDGAEEGTIFLSR